MKYLLILLLVGVLCFSIYKQRQENTELKAALNSSNREVAELQKKYDALRQARPGNSPAVAGTPGQPASQAGKPQSGAWMWDPNHVSPLGPPPSLGKK